MTKTPLETLIAVRNRLNNQTHLPKGAFFDESNCFCLVGAINIEASHPRENPSREDIIDLATQCFGHENAPLRNETVALLAPHDRSHEGAVFSRTELMLFNDEHTKEEVLARIDEAIEKHSDLHI